MFTMCVLSKTQEGVCHMVQEASKIPNGKKEAVQTSSIDAANAAQFVRHLEEDPLIQRKQDAGGLSMMDAHSDNLTCGSGACAPSKTLEHLQLPVMNRDMRARIMGILWANWEVLSKIPLSPCSLLLHAIRRGRMLEACQRSVALIDNPTNGLRACTFAQTPAHTCTSYIEHRGPTHNHE